MERAEVGLAVEGLIPKEETMTAIVCPDEIVNAPMGSVKVLLMMEQEGIVD